MLKRESLIGRKFFRLRVLRFDRKISRQEYYICRCECGNTKSIRKSSLIGKDTKSCGCLRKEKSAKNGLANKTHGMRQSTVHKSWCNMKNRCSNKNNPRYKDYGGRGITVCKRWHKFENFYADMGDPPKGLTLERVNNNGNYCKSNCKWATYKEQANNRRKTGIEWKTYFHKTHRLAQTGWPCALKA